MKSVALSFLFLLAVHPCFSQKQEENQDLKAVTNHHESARKSLE